MSLRSNSCRRFYTLNFSQNNIVTEEICAISRRRFLGLGLIALSAILVPDKIQAAVKDTPSEKKISLYNVYTQEKLETVYWRDGEFIPEVLDEINHIFRDLRSGKVKAIKHNLIDLLSSLQLRLKTKEPFHIVSGYRTPRSNAILRKKRKGVARNSLHMYGKAVDINLPGYNLKALRRTAMKLKGGGVGYYPSSKFIHVDVGEVRYWRG